MFFSLSPGVEALREAAPLLTRGVADLLPLCLLCLHPQLVDICPFPLKAWDLRFHKTLPTVHSSAVDDVQLSHKVPKEAKGGKKRKRFVTHTGDNWRNWFRKKVFYFEWMGGGECPA